jgi:hypothetical protein
VYRSEQSRNLVRAERRSISQKAAPYSAEKVNDRMDGGGIERLPLFKSIPNGPIHFDFSLHSSPLTSVPALPQLYERITMRRYQTAIVLKETKVIKNVGALGGKSDDPCNVYVTAINSEVIAKELTQRNPIQS